MRFNFSGNGYLGILTHKVGVFSSYVTAVFDTGCTMTSIGLYSLKHLLNCEYDDILSKIEDRYFGDYTQDASGGIHRNVRVIIPGVSLSNISNNYSDDNVKFDRFLL